MSNPLEPLVETYQKMVDDQDEKGTAEKFKEASDIFFDSLRTEEIIEREGEHPLIAIGIEDDGTLPFDRSNGNFRHAFDSYWIDSLVNTLLKAKSRIEEESK